MTDTVYLTRSQQRAMDGAVRRSFRVIEDPKLIAARARIERLEAALRTLLAVWHDEGANRDDDAAAEREARAALGD